MPANQPMQPGIGKKPPEPRTTPGNHEKCWLCLKLWRGYLDLYCGTSSWEISQRTESLAVANLN